VTVDVEGDEAFTAWAHRAVPQLERVARLLCADRHAGQDLTQDVLERMYPRWARIEDPDAYARRALTHAATSRWRYRARRPERTLEPTTDTTAVPSPVSAVESRIDLMSALAQLPARQRAVLVLRYFEDCTERDTADLLDINIGTVKSQTARALTRLRAAGLHPNDNDADRLTSRSTR